LRPRFEGSFARNDGIVEIHSCGYGCFPQFFFGGGVNATNRSFRVTPLAINNLEG
jgi:hypothetical protein